MGPTEDAIEYFGQLGFKQPDGMESADYLLVVASLDRHLLRRAEEGVPIGRCVLDSIRKNQYQFHNQVLDKLLFTKGHGTIVRWRYD